MFASLFFFFFPILAELNQQYRFFSLKVAMLGVQHIKRNTQYSNFIFGLDVRGTSTEILVSTRKEIPVVLYISSCLINIKIKV
jgi:hypothetical protein